MFDTFLFSNLTKKNQLAVVDEAALLVQLMLWKSYGPEKVIFEDCSAPLWEKRGRNSSAGVASPTTVIISWASRPAQAVMPEWTPFWFYLKEFHWNAVLGTVLHEQGRFQTAFSVQSSSGNDLLPRNDLDSRCPWSDRTWLELLPRQHLLLYWQLLWNIFSLHNLSPISHDAHEAPPSHWDSLWTQISPQPLTLPATAERGHELSPNLGPLTEMIVHLTSFDNVLFFNWQVTNHRLVIFVVIRSKWARWTIGFFRSWPMLSRRGQRSWPSATCLWCLIHLED